MDPFTAIMAFLATTGETILAGAEAAGTAIAEGAAAAGEAALGAAEATGGAVVEGAKQVGNAVADGASKVWNTLPKNAQSSLKSGAKEFSKGFTNPKSDLIVSNSDGSTNWGHTLARMSGAGGRNIAAGVAKRVVDGNPQHSSNARKLTGHIIGSLI